jgi:hypothetical protein
VRPKPAAPRAECQQPCPAYPLTLGHADAGVVAQSPIDTPIAFSSAAAPGTRHVPGVHETRRRSE